MLERIIGFSINRNFKEGHQVILNSRRFHFKKATIRKILKADTGDVNKNKYEVATDDGENFVVDDSEIYRQNDTYDDFEEKAKEIDDVIKDDIFDQQKKEYRPIGRGTGKERDAFQVAVQALKTVEKLATKLRIPVVGIRYESNTIKKWHNGFNTLWDGTINFSIDFLNKNGQRVSATIKVPVEKGIVKTPEYIFDSMNRKYKLDKNGLDDFINGIGWEIEENPDESVYSPGGTYPALAKISFANDKEHVDDKLIDILYKLDKTSEIKKEGNKQEETIKIAGKKVNYKQKIITAQNPLNYAKKFMTSDDFEEFKKLWAIRDMVKHEIESQEEYNQARGFEKDKNINYNKLRTINKQIENILDNSR